ncbi:hypothetical protein GE09DRAFT_1045038 [Coniochaeta sp. 2T2.1]|nr:hypothetical protein GE09DRAFT_1045038 [Coniochaeta sp. 2T2.1]
MAALECKDSTSTALASILEWYPTVPEPVTDFVHDLVDARSELQPEAEALCSSDRTLSYRELSDLSSRLARQLVAEGVKAEVIVPLFFEKSLWAVVGILGVMKAGGAFLMLDTSLPIGRIKAIVDQTGAGFALTSPKGLEVCGGLVERRRVVDAQSLDNLPQLERAEIRQPTLKPGNAAYLIFTSGSTGTPKGVIIEHSQLATTCVNVGERMGCDSQRRAVQFASYAFDAFISDILPTLIYGGTVCIPSGWERDNDLVGAMCRLGVNAVKITPSLANMLELEKLPALRSLILGGESVPRSLIDKWATKVKMILVYGPTECCIICFTTDCSSHTVVPGEIGQPMGSRGWIVKQGDCTQLADIGEIGELLIEGPVVGRGYLGDAAKTALQFIERPEWMPAGHDRVYRTGDLARYEGDGVVCYAGRADNQVKIRGQRLELEEVERKLIACLSGIDGVAVQHVVVEAVTFAGLSSKQLVGRDVPSVIFSHDDKARFSALVQGLESSMKLVLPSYAVPSVWIPMKTFPYTVSRKIDRKQLRQLVAPLSIRELSVFHSAPEATGSANGITSHTAAEKEAKLIKIWAAVFGADLSTITLQDSFFRMGGDSLLAMRLVSLARQSGLTLTVAGVVGAPTLAALASTATEIVTTAELSPFSLVQHLDIAALRQEGALQCRVANEDLEDLYPCSTMQMHYVTGYPEYERDIAGPWHWQSQQVYRVPPSLDLERFRAVWNAAIQRHQSLRTRLILSAAGVFQVVLRGGSGPSVWEEAQGLEEYLEKDKSCIMGFGDGLVRLALVHAQPSSDRFVAMTMQHIIYDAFSLGILFNELEQDYYGEELPSGPRPKMNRYIQYVTGADKTAALEFWTSYLAGAVTKPLLTFPPDVKLFDLNVSETSLTTKMPEPRTSEATTATIMEVAAGLAIAGRLGCADVVFNSDRSGRNLPVEGIQDLVGPTTLFLPVRIHVDESQTLSDLLRECQAFQNDKLPFEHLGWLELREIDELKPPLRHSLNININTQPLKLIGQRWGLEFVTSHAMCDDPFGINIDIYGDNIKWTVYYDARFFDSATASSLLADIQAAFFLIVNPNRRPNLTVGDVLTAIRSENCRGWKEEEELQSCWSV